MTLHTFISAVTLLAVAVNPLVASLRPCCCSQQAEQVGTCCQQRVSDADRSAAQGPAADGPERPCCRGRNHPSGRPSSIPLRGCCCVKTAPAANLVRGASAVPSLEKQVLDGVVSSPALLPGVSVEPSLALESRGATLSGVSLLALFCVWLK